MWASREERSQCQDGPVLLPAHSFWCQVLGQRPAPHAGLRYGQQSQSCHHPPAIVTKDAAVSCRGQQHPATNTSRGQNCPANESQQNSFPILSSFSTAHNLWYSELPSKLIKWHDSILDLKHQEAAVMLWWTEYETQQEACKKSLDSMLSKLYTEQEAKELMQWNREYNKTKEKSPKSIILRDGF